MTPDVVAFVFFAGAVVTFAGAMRHNAGTAIAAARVRIWSALIGITAIGAAMLALTQGARRSGVFMALAALFLFASAGILFRRSRAA